MINVADTKLIFNFDNSTDRLDRAAFRTDFRLVCGRQAKAGGGT